MNDKTTISEAMGSVTGFDEIAVEKHFGTDLYVLAETKPLMVTRAAAFVHLRHQGMADKDAYQQVMDMTVNDLESYFEEEPDDAMPDEPDSELGKDSSQREPALTG